MVFTKGNEMMNLKANTGTSTNMVTVPAFLAGEVVSLKNATAKAGIFGSVSNTSIPPAPVPMIGTRSNTIRIIRNSQSLIPADLSPFGCKPLVSETKIGFQSFVDFLPVIKGFMSWLKTHLLKRWMISFPKTSIPCTFGFKTLACFGMVATFVLGIGQTSSICFASIDREGIKCLPTPTPANLSNPFELFLSDSHNLYYTHKLEVSKEKAGEFRETLPGSAGGNPEPSQGYTLGRCNDYRRGLVLLITGQSARPERDEIVCAHSNVETTRPYTLKLEKLAQINVNDATRTALRNDMVRVIDSAVWSQFNECKIRYAGTATDGGDWATAGTATTTCASQLNKYHTRKICDYMAKSMLAPPYDGDSYMAIVTVAAHGGLYSEVESVMAYTKYPAKGEFGMYYNCRFVKETAILDNAMGTSSLYGEAFFFGAETVAEAVAVPEEIRFQPDYVDFGRSPALAWYAILGFEIMHSANPDNRIVKYTSADAE
jgi:hypothetical protein